MTPDEAFKAALAQAETLLHDQIDKPTLRHPDTGALIADANIEASVPTQVIRYLPPPPPTRSVVTEWDDDGPVAWRELSDGEFAESVEAYNKANAEWMRTRGRYRVQVGPVEILGHFTFEDGSTAEALYGEGGWRWISTSAGSAPRR